MVSEDALVSLAVVGAGTMGQGIAQLAITHGIEVRLFDPSEGALQRGQARIESGLAKAVEKAKLTPDDELESRRRLLLHRSLASAVEGVQFVVEAAPECMEIKKRIFAELSDLAPSTAVLGSNTSSLSLTEIAAAASGPDRVIGLHFFNPPPVMKLLEVVLAEQTSAHTVQRALRLGAILERETIEVRDVPGFATSRLGIALGLEAIRMLEEGVASAEDIDRAMVLGYRHPMGPLRLTDLVGLDVRLAIAEHLHSELGERFRPPTLLRRLVRAGKLGQKSGQGFYDWASNG